MSLQAIRRTHLLCILLLPALLRTPSVASAASVPSAPAVARRSLSSAVPEWPTLDLAEGALGLEDAVVRRAPSGSRLSAGQRGEAEAESSASGRSAEGAVVVARSPGREVQRSFDESLSLKNALKDKVALPSATPKSNRGPAKGDCVLVETVQDCFLCPKVGKHYIVKTLDPESDQKYQVDGCECWLYEADVKPAAPEACEEVPCQCKDTWSLSGYEGCADVQGCPALSCDGFSDTWCVPTDPHCATALADSKGNIYTHCNSTEVLPPCVCQATWGLARAAEGDPTLKECVNVSGCTETPCDGSERPWCLVAEEHCDRDGLFHGHPYKYCTPGEALASGTTTTKPETKTTPTPDHRNA